MKTKDDIRNHLAVLKDEAKARASHWGYRADPGMVGGWGLTKYDCGLILTSLGQFLGYQVYGKDDWHSIVLPGQIDPNVEGKERNITYLGRAGACADYTWFEGTSCVGVFETDGRDNRRSTHLPTASPVTINPHLSTNNLFKLSAPVLRDYFGYVPGSRAWILFQIDNKQKNYSAKHPWVHRIEDWRAAFSECADLTGAVVIRDTELFDDLFVEHVHRNRRD